MRLLTWKEPEWEIVRSLLASHADEAGPLVVHGAVLVLLLATHTHKAGTSCPWPKVEGLYVGRQVVVELLRRVQLVVAFVGLLSAHTHKTGGPFQPAQVVAVLKAQKDYMNNLPFSAIEGLA